MDRMDLGGSGMRVFCSGSVDRYIPEVTDSNHSCSTCDSLLPQIKETISNPDIHGQDLCVDSWNHEDLLTLRLGMADATETTPGAEKRATELVKVSWVYTRKDRGQEPVCTATDYVSIPTLLAILHHGVTYDEAWEPGYTCAKVPHLNHRFDGCSPESKLGASLGRAVEVNKCKIDGTSPRRFLGGSHVVA